MAYVSRAGGGMAIGLNSQVTPETNPILARGLTNYTAELSMAFGYGAKALNSDSISIGQFTEVLGSDSVAMGFGAYIGRQKMTNKGEKPTSIHESGFNRDDGKSTAELLAPAADKRFNFSTVMGSGAKGFGYQTTAYGAGAEASGSNALAVGTNSRAKGGFSSAIGASSNAEGMFSNALGARADALEEGSLALGRDSIADKMDGIALGSYSKTNVAEGIVGYDPIAKEQANVETLLAGDETAKQAYQSLAATKSAVKNAETELLKSIEKRNEVDDKRVENEQKQLEVNDRYAALNKQYKTSDDRKKEEYIQAKNSIVAEYNALTAERDDLDKQSKQLHTEVEDKSTAWNDARAKMAEARKAIGDKAGAWISTAAGVSVGDEEKGITRQITNVAAGSKDTDAVNVAQLRKLAEAGNKSNAQLAAQLGATAGDVANLQNNVTQINTVVMGNTKELQQLRTEHDSLKAQADRTDRNVERLERNVHKINKDLRAGIAGATALSFLQSGYRAGESAVSVAVGTYKGENALAVGYGRRLDNNKIEVKLGASVNSRSDLNAGGSIGYHW